MSGALNAIGAFGQGFAGGAIRRRDMDARDAEIEAMRRAPAQAAPGAIPQTGMETSTLPPPAQNTLHGLLYATEGAGDPDTLFGHAQRAGGRFAGTKVSEMTLGELYNFTDPSGEYGQWVKSENPDGVVATPLGKGQIVGTTLRATAREMGLPDTTVFNRETQEQMIAHLAKARLARGGNDRAEQMRQLRLEWHGFRNVPDASLLAAIEDFEARGGVIRPRSRPAGAVQPTISTKGQ